MKRLIPIDSEKLGWYTGNNEKGYFYAENDGNRDLVLLNPKDEPHVYIISNFKTVKTTEIAKAIYELLHDENEREGLVHLKILNKTYDFYFYDSLLKIFRDLCVIDEINLLEETE